MLILPLHRPLTRANFPWVTAALILVNCFVFFVLQGGDDRLAQRAIEQYDQANLGTYEFPLYLKWADEHGRRQQMELIRRFSAQNNSHVMVQFVQSDDAFLRELHADRLVTPQTQGYAEWKEARAAFERLWNRQFTVRFVLRYDEVNPLRMFTSMFMHGGFGHLFGNMLFLAFLGLLVEGGLGPGLFLAVYLLGGLGAQCVTLAWRWGAPTFGLGASGAIAGLMGAYCVLWGLRKVRFFWWFFVAFNYVKAPALVLLPFWLGWELFNLLYNSDAHVLFDAHAGGIMTGALLAYGVRALKWERHEFLDEDARREAAVQADTDYDTAMEHLGRLDVARARPLLEALDQRMPARLDVRVGLYRCARYSRQDAAAQAAALRVFELLSPRADVLRQVKSVYDDLRKAGGSVPELAPGIALRLARAWLQLGADADAEELLRRVTARQPELPELPELWMKLAQRAGEGTPAQRERLAFILQRFPQSSVAKPARFLLEQGGG